MKIHYLYNLFFIFLLFQNIYIYKFTKIKSSKFKKNNNEFFLEFFHFLFYFLLL